jgi:hypothetical protein
MRKVIGLVLLTSLFSSGCFEVTGPEGPPGPPGPEGPPGAALHFDDFSESTVGPASDGEDDWLYGPHGTVSVVNETLRLVGDDSGYLCESMMAGTDTLSDFELEVDSEWESGATSYGYGILFRDTGESNQQYRLIITANGWVRVGIGTTALADWVEHPGITAQGANRLRVRCIGSSIDVYVNGYLIGFFTDATYESGSVGLFVDGEQVVVFDNVKLWSW